MKKLFLIMALGVISFSCSAQVEKLVLKPAKSSVVSNSFELDSIKRVLPGPIGRTLSVVTAHQDVKAWDLSVNPASDSFQPTYYQVFLKSRDGKKTMVYDKDGNLLRVRQVLKNADVPERVINTLNTRYKDWTLVDKEERQVNSLQKMDVDYKVILKKGLFKKAVLLDPNGEVKLAIPTV
jgi:hypothetical protein